MFYLSNNKLIDQERLSYQCIPYIRFRERLFEEHLIYGLQNILWIKTVPNHTVNQNCSKPYCKPYVLSRQFMTNGIKNFYHIFINQIIFSPSLYIFNDCTLLYITIHYCTLLYITVHYWTLLYITGHYCTFYFIYLYNTITYI